MAQPEKADDFVGPPEPPRPPVGPPQQVVRFENTTPRPSVGSAWVGIGPIFLALGVLVVWGIVRAVRGVGAPSYDGGQVIGVVIAGVFVAIIALFLFYPLMGQDSAPPGRTHEMSQSLTWEETGAGPSQADAVDRATEKLCRRLSAFARENYGLSWTPGPEFVSAHLSPRVVDEKEVDLGQDNQGRALGTARQVTVQASVPADVGPILRKQFRMDTRASRIVMGAKVIGGLFVAAAFLCLFFHLAGSRTFLALVAVLVVLVPIVGLIARVAAERDLDAAQTTEEAVHAGETP